jgi:D-alanyl-D-alanine carboxypeptidase
MFEMTRPKFRGFMTCIAALSIGVLIPCQTLPAHLCIIREGAESNGLLEALDNYGHAVAAGDFNGDGYDDLAVGATGESVGSEVGAGAVIVSYGCPTGITHIGSHVITQSSTGGTSFADERFGWALAVGDFNHDGYDDLAVGSTGENSFQGQVTIILGNASGLHGAATTISQSNGPGIPENGDNFGGSLTSGDFNGDNFDDLAVGIYGEGIEGGSGTLNLAGAVAIFFGGNSGITTSGAYIITEDDTAHPATANTNFGWSLAAGDINQDGKDDLVVGIPRKSTGGFTNNGAIEVFFGSNSGPSASGSQFLTPSSFGQSNQDGAKLGYAVSCRDYNSDHFADVVMGLPEFDVLGLEDVGQVWVARGTIPGLSTTTLNVVPNLNLLENGKFGWTVAFGNYDGDAYLDLAIGQPDFGFGTVTKTGRVSIYAGTASGYQTAVSTGKSQETFGEASEQGDQFGYCLAFGAFAGGAREGLAIGAPTEDFDPNPSVAEWELGTQLLGAGAVYIDLPWKQVQNLQSRECMVVGCNGEILFSQKPFERHYIASTTKIMTLLLIAENMEGPNPTIALSDNYVFPLILTGANGGTIGGSMTNICPNESVTVQDLIWTMMLQSGNDSAFGLADAFVNPGSTCNSIACGTAGGDIAIFRSLMNARAAQLGMSVTSFGNPSGAALGTNWQSDNFSSPYDMYKLASTAMQSPMIRNIVNDLTYVLSNRQTGINGCVPTGTNTPFNTLAFALPGGESPDHPSGSGIKGGSGGGAGNSTIVAADTVAGRAYAFVYGEPNRTQMKNDAIAMLNFATTNTCNLPLNLPPTPPGTVNKFPNLPVSNGIHFTHTGPFYEDPTRNMNIWVTLSQGTASANLQMLLSRTVELDLVAGDSARMSVGPFKSNGGIIVTNKGITNAEVHVAFPAGGFDQTATLLPSQNLQIPSYVSSTMLSSVLLTVGNVGTSGTAILEVRELDMPYDLALTGNSGFGVRMTSTRLDGEDQVDIHLIGQDASPTAQVDLLVANTFDADPGCDGVLDVDDVPAFVQALLDPAGYEANFPSCYIGSADRNGDGKIDGRDVAQFVAEVMQ